MGREPGKPRGKMTAYAFFVQTCREEHKQSNPGETVIFSEFSKKCAGRWKMMDVADKRPFEEMAARDKLRWEEEMKHWTPTETGKRGKKQKRKKDPNAPKRPQTAFFLFCADHRDQLRALHPDDRIGDIAKKLGDAWAHCEPEKRKRYEETAANQKEEYRRLMEAYKSGRSPGEPSPNAGAVGSPIQRQQQVAPQMPPQKRQATHQITNHHAIHVQQQQIQVQPVVTQQQQQVQQVQVPQRQVQQLHMQQVQGHPVVTSAHHVQHHQIQQVHPGHYIQRQQYVQQQHIQAGQQQMYEDEDDDSEEESE